MAKLQPKHIWSRVGFVEYYSETATGRVAARVEPQQASRPGTNPVRSVFIGDAYEGDFVNIEAAKAAVESKVG